MIHCSVRWRPRCTQRRRELQEAVKEVISIGDADLEAVCLVMGYWDIPCERAWELNCLCINVIGVKGAIHEHLNTKIERNLCDLKRCRKRC